MNTVLLPGLKTNKIFGHLCECHVKQTWYGSYYVCVNDSTKWLKKVEDDVKMQCKRCTVQQRTCRSGGGHYLMMCAEHFVIYNYLCPQHETSLT